MEPPRGLRVSPRRVHNAPRLHRAELPLQRRTQQHCAPPTHTGLSCVLVPESSCPWLAALLLSIHEEEAPDAGRARAEPRGLQSEKERRCSWTGFARGSCEHLGSLRGSPVQYVAGDWRGWPWKMLVKECGRASPGRSPALKPRGGEWGGAGKVEY